MDELFSLMERNSGTCESEVSVSYCEVRFVCVFVWLCVCQCVCVSPLRTHSSSRSLAPTHLLTSGCDEFFRMTGVQ